MWQASRPRAPSTARQQHLQRQRRVLIAADQRRVRRAGIRRIACRGVSGEQRDTLADARGMCRMHGFRLRLDPPWRNPFVQGHQAAGEGSSGLCWRSNCQTPTPMTVSGFGAETLARTRRAAVPSAGSNTAWTWACTAVACSCRSMPRGRRTELWQACAAVRVIPPVPCSTSPDLVTEHLLCTKGLPHRSDGT
jgi:hypothetical protein